MAVTEKSINAELLFVEESMYLYKEKDKPRLIEKAIITLHKVSSKFLLFPTVYDNIVMGTYVNTDKDYLEENIE